MKFNISFYKTKLYFFHAILVRKYVHKRDIVLFFYKSVVGFFSTKVLDLRETLILQIQTHKKNCSGGDHKSEVIEHATQHHYLLFFFYIIHMFVYFLDYVLIRII